MTGRLNFLSRLRKRILSLKGAYLCLPIFYRITLGNSLIIILGAIGGTLLTRHLAGRAADLWLIILFASIGITLIVLINGWIIRTALRPLHELRAAVDQLQAGQVSIDAHLLQGTDPDIQQLALSLDAMVKQLEERNLKLRALSKRAINAQEEERKRIARSLHDDTSQALSMLIINLERLENRLPDRYAPLRDLWPRAEQEGVVDLQAELSSARQLAMNTLKELRKVIYGLRPTMLDDLGLLPAIRWYARSHLEGAGVRVEFQTPDEILPLSSELKTTLFRIAQEAINNIARHAQAQSAVIRLSQNGQKIYLQVEDDGQGFDVAQTSGQALRLQRLGLLGIQERAELVGGEVTVASRPGQGTRLQISVPLSGRGGDQDG